MSDSSFRDILSELRNSSKDRFAFTDKDAVYAALGIGAAGDLEHILAAEVGLGQKEFDQLRGLVRQLALSTVPPAFPADEHYLRILEGVDRPPPVSANRSLLGYCHYKTRDGILARLRSSYFQDMLEHFKPAIEGRIDSSQAIIQTFLENIVARRMETYASKIREVLEFSVYEDWDDDRIDRFSHSVMASLLGWFIEQPDVFVDRPEDVKPNLLPKNDSLSRSTTLCRASIENLRILREVSLARATKQQMSPDTVSRYQLLSESSWYRYFFFDENGLERWARSGVLGFDRTETFDDFIEKLRTRENWKGVTLPTGETVHDVEVIEAGRQIGAHVIELKDGATLDVEVTILPQLTSEEISKLLRQGAVRVGRRVWIVSPPTAQSESYFVRRVGQRWAEPGSYFFLKGSAIALVRTPSPGRYEFRERGAAQAVVILDATDLSSTDARIVFLPESEAFRVSVSSEARLPEEVFSEPLVLKISGVGVAQTFPLISRVIDAQSSIYRIEAERVLPYSLDLLGIDLKLSISALSWEAKFPVPSLILVLESGGRLRLLEHNGRIPATQTWSLRVYSPGAVVLKTPTEQAEVNPDEATRVGSLQLKSSHQPRYLRIELAEASGPGSDWFEIASSQGGAPCRIYRVPGIALQIDGVPIEAGEAFVQRCGSHVCKLETYPQTHRNAVVSVAQPAGRSTTLTAEAGREFQLGFDAPGLYKVRIEMRPLPSSTFVVACLGDVTISPPAWIEAGQTGGPFVLKAGMPVRLVYVRGLTDLACSPGIGTRSPEYSIWGRARGPPRTAHPVEFLLEFVFPSGNRAPLTLSCVVDIVGVALRVDNEPFWGAIVHEYRAERIVAWGLHRTVVARCGRREVTLPGAGQAPANLTELFPHAPETAIIEFVVQDGSSEVLLKRTLTVSWRYCPTLLIPDGVEGVGAGGCPMGITPPTDDLSLHLTPKDHADGAGISLQTTQGGVFLPRLEALTRLRVEKAHAPIQFFFERSHQELIVKPWNGATSVTHYAVSFDGELQTLDKEVVPVSLPERLLELCNRLGAIVGDIPAFDSRLRIVESGVLLGWRVRCSSTYLTVLRTLAKDSVKLALEAFDAGEGETSDARPTIVLLDMADSLRLSGRWSAHRDGPILYLVPAGWSDRRAGRSESFTRLFEALVTGKISNPTDMSQWSGLEPADHQSLVDMASEYGVEGVIARAINEQLGQAMTSQDRRRIETINSLLRRSDLLLRLPFEERRMLQSRIASLFEGMLRAPASDLPKLKGLVTALLDGVSLRDIGYQTPAGPVEFLRAKAELELTKLDQSGRADEAISLLERLEAIFPQDPRLPFERAVLLYSRQDPQSKREMVSALQKALSADEKTVRKIAERREGTHRYLITNVWCECGRIRWLTVRVCPSCGAKW